jgi:hypothetical protein
MKKNLLLGCALLTAGSAFAAIPTDGCTYQPVNGVTMTSIWCASRDINTAAFNQVFEDNGLNQSYGRRCAVYNDVIYVTNGYKQTEGDGDNAVTHYYWNLVSFDLFTGDHLATVPVTLDGKPLDGLLGAMNIGVDSYGHVWVSPFNSGSEGTKIPIYVLDVATGALTSAGNAIEWPADDAASRKRIDFSDITGDVTGVEAAGVYGACAATEAPYAYRFVREQGSDDWAAGMDGYAAWPAEDVKLWPETAAAFGGDNSCLIWAEGTDEIFYANGSSTYPTQYSCAGGISELLGSFEQADADCTPDKVGPVGAWEMTLGNKMYLAYGNTQCNDGGAAKIAVMGGDATGGTFEGMTPGWTLPGDEKTYAQLSNGGIRIHPMLPAYHKDANGKEGVYIVNFNAQSVMAVYLMAEEGYQAAGVSTVAADDANAPKVYYNLQGVRVNNPENGLYIVKQGNTVTKTLVK